MKCFLLKWDLCKKGYRNDSILNVSVSVTLKAIEVSVKLARDNVFVSTHSEADFTVQ